MMMENAFVRNCFTFDNSTKKCNAIDCWKWNSIEEKCEKAGKEWLPAMILQGIPLTGVFGSGFGNIGRWDIFGMYMGHYLVLVYLYV